MRVLQQSIQKKVPINFYKNFSNDDYYRILKMSKCLVGNSSSGIRECSFLGVPVVNIGKRQDYRERGKNVVDVKPVEEEITKAIKFQIKKTYKKQNIYGDGKSSDKIIHILANTKIDILKRFYKRT
jgi:UDP-N-acetylglucosamine 2-epimerase